jgi:hypothetical protein
VIVCAFGLDFTQPAFGEEDLTFDGFVVQGPSGDGWKEGYWSDPILPVTFLNTLPDKSTESLSVSAVLWPLSGPERGSIEKRLQEGIRRLARFDNLRIRPAHPLRSIGTPPICLQFHAFGQDMDHYPERPHYQVDGWSCRHPFNTGLMVSLIYMRRAPVADRPDSLRSDADIFLDRFVFIPAAMDEMIASALDEFAERLEQANRIDDAKEMGRHADLLRQAAQSQEGSFYLGFNPGDDLRSYADFLKAHGDTVASRELEELSAQLEANSVAEYLCIEDFEGCIAKTRATDTGMLSFAWQ